MNFIEMFKDYLVIGVIMVCLIVGFILKNIVKTDKINPYIPLIMAVLGVVLNLWFNGWIFNPTVLIGGLASGLASSGAYDGYKAIKNYFGNITKDLIHSNNTDSANDTKEQIARTVVQAVEQIYKDLHGEEKLQKALESASEMLSEKGITVTDLELRMLIESTLAEFNGAFNSTAVDGECYPSDTETVAEESKSQSFTAKQITGFAPE